MLVAFVHLLCTYSTVVLQFFTVNSITADTLWTRTGHVYQCLSEGSTVKEKIVHKTMITFSCSATVLTFHGSYENFPAVAWSPRKRSPR